mmetsp:Transcript_54262/g.129342  ORF Transcript_54262/g.129342 Transcript_54262/m.129342 type:complete len:81 (+) Transcript_54262:490-732(+)
MRQSIAFQTRHMVRLDGATLLRTRVLGESAAKIAHCLVLQPFWVASLILSRLLLRSWRIFPSLSAASEFSRELFVVHEAM